MYYKLGQTCVTNWGKIYYKLGHALQIRPIITNWGIRYSTFLSHIKDFSFCNRKLDHSPIPQHISIPVH